MQIGKRVEYAPAAIKTLAKMDTPTARRIRDKIALLATDPAALANNVRSLTGRPGLKRLRVGDWRVIFTESLLVLSVVKIATRGSAYERETG